MVIFSIAIFSIELLAAIILQLAKRRLPKVSKGDPIKAISFIIPFHNEQDRILPLIQSINASQFIGKCEFIFVDDYSTDATEQILKENLKIPYSCLKNEDKRGKKHAIHTGVLTAAHEFIITWDADIKFTPHYIQRLFDLAMADLIILPVKMTTKSLASKLATIEFTFIETFNLGFAGLHKAIACNGANLGFRKSTFLELNNARADYNIPSGDDMFLMWAMQKEHKNISVFKNKALAVSTSAPPTFLNVFRQRQRWKGKMKSPMNFATAIPLFLQFLVIISSAFTILLGIQNPVFFMLFGLKFLAELIATWSFVKQHFSHIFMLLIHQIWYPVYVLMLIGIPFSKEKRWR